ncbi:MAG: hypothetical protein JSS23_00120 [Proteobacteria bacterium]|nr:hypothetical protein [Pseudomonadota bacterium]
MSPTPAPAAIKPKLKLKFYSPDSTPIRVNLPDGRRLVVNEPREIPAAFNRAAMKAGCLTTDMPDAVTMAGPTTAASDDPITRAGLLEKAIRDAFNANDVEDESTIDARFADAFTRNGIPNVLWLSTYLGFKIDAAERDAAWGKIQKEIEDEDEPETTDVE